ncbi:hypothetical protein GLAREA_11908 [Glarea lozoyensis ATCC 20868]|uniref:Uncharacterized protein n=1 Tax=Glarea lozoyensis (strain ATCC 20868 / MF5171) TaxID=1116229 RepID=S3DII9_GLAL2|nr:uncharacterized protein GLAREA_11908 [Glarea lozoyensis ATCC 20868]EPE31826.1 hypothetical protein GLAREA_11908 [Glarea lozoyensis ATCC 20868]
MRAAIGGVLSTRASRIQPEKENNTTNNSSKESTARNNPKISANGNTPAINARPTRPSYRPPLQSRDHNATMRGSQKGGTPLTAKSGNANMPSYEKPTNSSRPLMPTLSASAKGSSRPPLTPRVAGSGPTVASTPISRQGPRTKNSTPSASKEDISTPVSAFLNNNITPRSGSRKIRVDSTNTTPTGTPNGTPLHATSNDSFRGGQDATPTPGLGISALDRDLNKRPTVSFSTGSSEVGGYARSPGANGPADSKFFFASDAKTTQPPTRPPLPSKSSSTFFYANGESIPPPPSSGASAVGSSLGEEKNQPKFFHANGTPDLQLSPSPHFAPPRASSVVSSSSRMTLTRAATASPIITSPSQRPMSPSKLSQQPTVAPLRNTPSIQSAILPRPPVSGRGSSASNITLARRSSIESTSRVSSHGRSISMGSSTSPPSRKVSSPVELMPPSTPLNLITTGLVSSPEQTPDPPSSIDEVASDHLVSPMKAGQSIEHLNELAANARRERKVLDLEITNSSLAAINRTLEREMRKQTAELRRYRRLSRSGRLSIASSSLRTSTGTFSLLDGGLDGQDLSDMSEEEEEEEGFSSETSDSMDDGSLSPAAMAESDLRHRQKDEKRLQLDLSKHQQLLVDSQQMNQSLKRCLGWTEALISEGKKALEYKVRVDIELGGRVLVPEELESPEEEEDNEGMSDIGARMLREARQKAAVNASAWEARDDRDSGIEVDGSHRERLAEAFNS